MANPALLAIKPLLKAIGKEAVKLIGKKAAKAGVSAGVKAAAKGSLSALDVVNIARAAVDKKMVASVAKSLGMSSAELRKITSALRMTDARRKAVQGKNFLKNVNRFVKDPQKSIKQYVKNELKRKTTKTVQDALKETADNKESAETAVKRNALMILEGKLKKINPALSVPKSVWQSIEELDIDDIFEVMEYLEADFYYTANNSDPDNPIYLDSTHKGFKQGLEEQDFIAMIEGMLLNGFHSSPIDGII